MKRMPTSIRSSLRAAMPEPHPRTDRTHETREEDVSRTAALTGSTDRPLRLVRFPVVRDRTGLSRSTIWRLEQ